MSPTMFDRGVTTGFDTMLEEAQALTTYDALRASIGFLTRLSSPPSDWAAGFMHGVSLGASMRLDRVTQTQALRDGDPA